VSALHSPLVILLEKDCPDQEVMAVLVREDDFGVA